MKFEGEYFGSAIVDASGRLIDIGDTVLTDGVAEKVAVFIIAVEPKIGWREVLVVDKFTLDLEVGEVVVFTPFLTCL